MSACGKCGETGHNARTCGKAAAPARPKVKRKTAAASPAPRHGSTVTEALRARRDQLAKEMATIDRILADLPSVGVE